MKNSSPTDPELIKRGLEKTYDRYWVQKALDYIICLESELNALRAHATKQETHR
jgi:hypothetical protein